VPTILPAIRIFNLHIRILYFYLRVPTAASGGYTGSGLEAGCGERSHGRVIVEFVLVIINNGVGIFSVVGIGVGAAGGDALKVVVGGQSTVSSVCGERRRSKWRQMVIGRRRSRRTFPLVDGRGC
jgi:hypothetical protein